MNRARISLVIVGMFLAGCLNFKPVVDRTRYFVLTPFPENAPTTERFTEQRTVGFTPVEIPDYLESRQLVERSGAHEIRYLTGLRWAERMKHGIRRVLMANLDSQLGTPNATLTAWHRSEVRAVVSVTFQRFETDASGQASLEARWRLTDPAGTIVLRDGFKSITKPGIALPADPENAVATLSELLGELAKDLAQDIRSALP